jgi:hypothetical protein
MTDALLFGVFAEEGEHQEGVRAGVRDAQRTYAAGWTVLKGGGSGARGLVSGAAWSGPTVTSERAAIPRGFHGYCFLGHLR